MQPSFLHYPNSSLRKFDDLCETRGRWLAAMEDKRTLQRPAEMV